MTRIQDRWSSDSAEIKYFRADEFPLRMRLLRWLGRQTWIPKGQHRLLYFVMAPEKAPDYPFEVDFFGKRYRGNLADYIDWMVFAYGSYASSELALLKDAADYLRQKRSAPIHFVDVGANSGHHTLFMAGIADQTIAFEPFPGLVRAIEAKIALNNLANVKLIPAALGARNEVRDYFLGEGANAGTGTFIANEGERAATPIQLSIRRGDDVLAEEKLARLDLLKVDVEGFEPFVFEGLRQRILADRPIILTEMTEKSYQHLGSEKAFRDLFYEGARFACVAGRSGHGYRLEPFQYGITFETVILPPEYAEFAG
jgi:FkbM family methyltransferase